MSNPDFDVVIIGAGIAGAALTRALVNNGLRLALVEASPLAVDAVDSAAATCVDDFDSRVSAITPASQDFLSGIGAWNQLPTARLCPYQHMQVWDAEGVGRIDFHAAELDAPVLGHIVENRQLTRALLQELEPRPDLQLYNPARVQDVVRQGELTLVELEDGQQISGRLVVAADGALSRVRELAGFRTREWDYGHHALVTTVETAEPHAATAYQRFLDTGPLAFLPLAGAGESGEQHFCSIVWSVESDLAAQLLDQDQADFLQSLEAAIEGRLGTLLAASNRIGYPLRQRHAVDYVQPGIALLGDAAHTIHPLAGQGINLGLQDVAVLSRELRQSVARGASPGSLDVLKRYQRQRKGENLLMMAAMDGFKRLFGERQLPLRWLRNTGMQLVSRSGPLKHELMRHAMGMR